MRQITNGCVDMIRNDQVIENEIFNFNELEINEETSVADSLRIINVLEEIAQVKRKYLFMKMRNDLYYNESKSMYSEGLPDIFLNQMTEFESKMKGLYSDLFMLIGGVVTTKIIVANRKSLYIEDVIDKLQGSISIEFKGRIYSEKCKERNVNFEEYRLTEEYRGIMKEYDKEWSKRLKDLDNVLDVLDQYQEYISFADEKACRLESMQEIKVRIA